MPYKERYFVFLFNPKRNERSQDLSVHETEAEAVEAVKALRQQGLFAVIEKRRGPDHLPQE